MSAAHDLLDRMGLALEKGDTTRYPATESGPNARMRYWATELEDCIQFGVQLRSPQDSFSPTERRRLEAFGFEPRPNQRELFVRLPREMDEAHLMAVAAIAAASCLLKQK